MKFNLFVNPIMPGALDDDDRLRPLGRNNERWQQLIEEVRQLCIAADDLGYDCFSTTEHHFHSEGMEVSVAPMVWYADLAARTKRIKLAPIGLVLPSWDPIRCAEELAVLDHLTKGRVIAGFARGYQDRWVAVLGQKYRVTGTQSDETPTDVRNRLIFEEMFEIVKAAWTQDVLSYKGQFYEVPYPYEEGIKGWPAQEWTRTHGAPGELDEEGVLRGVCVVPKPYQQPHPPIFNAFSLSENTIRWAAKQHIIPQIQVSQPKEFTRLCKVYQEASAEHGRDLKLGEQVGAPRYIYLGKTHDEAYQRAVKLLGGQFYGYYSQFGFLEGFRNPGDPTPLRFNSPEETARRLMEHKFGLAGTVDEVKREIEALARCYADGKLEWLVWTLDQGLMPLEQALDQVETFATKIMPEFKD